MRYFMMKQDATLPYSFKLRDFNMKGKHQVFYLEQADELNDVSFIYVLGKGDEAYFDFIENPVYMASETVKHVLEMYQDELIFKKVVLINKEAQKQASYYQVLTEHLEGLSDKTPFYPDGREKKVILDKNKIKAHHAFQLKDSKGTYFIVSLAVVESLLRRNVSGILFEEIEVI